jgi:small membrane protein
VITLLLLLLLSALAIYAVSQRRKSPLVAWMIFLSSLAGMGLALFPEVTNALAAMLGVGRGADLIFYLFIVISLAAIFNLHLQIRRNHEILTELARSIALHSADKRKGTGNCRLP